MKTNAVIIALAALWLAASGAMAQAPAGTQTVWRCGPDGRSYGETPCPEGRAVSVADPRSPADIGQAQRRATRERLAAATLVRDRQAREAAAAAATAVAANLGPLRAGTGMAARPISERGRVDRPVKRKARRPASDGTWQATAPASRRGRG